MTFLTQHLLKRTSGYYFRLVVPKRLRLALGKSEIRHPLRTSSEFIAVQLSKRFWSHYQSVFESLTMKRSPIDPHVMSFGIAKMTVTEGTITYEGVTTDGPEDAKALTEFVRINQQQLDKQSESLVDLDQFDNVPTTGAKLNSHLSHISEELLQEKEMAKISSEQVNKIRVAHHTLIEIIGDKDINLVTLADVEKTKSILRQIPTHRTNTPIYAGKTLQQCIDLAKKHGKKPLDTSTVDQHLQKISGLFGWAIKNGYLNKPVNVFEGKTFQTKQQRTKSTFRDQFSHAELKIVFDPENYNDIENPYIFWAPLLSLLCGARLSEIAQLKISDIRVSSRIPYLNLRSTGENTEKGFKTTTSERIVPLHTLLLDIGFSAFVKDIESTGSERLFPHLKMSTKGSYGTNASKQFQYYLRNKLNITSKGKVFHSFRKNFGDALKQQGVDISSRCELMGHSFEHVSEESYANLTRLALKKKWIHKPFWKFLGLDQIKYVEHKFDNFKTTGGGSRKRKVK